MPEPNVDVCTFEVRAQLTKDAAITGEWTSEWAPTFFGLGIVLKHYERDGIITPDKVTGAATTSY